MYIFVLVCTCMAVYEMLISMKLCVYVRIYTCTCIYIGDMYPVTGTGKIVAAMLMVFSILFIALPVTFLSAAYGEAYEVYIHAYRHIYKQKYILACILCY